MIKIINEEGRVNIVAAIFESIIEGEDDTLKGKYLTFSVDKETFGIEIRHVREIIGIQEITEMPEMPEYMKGIINLRGSIIPIVDVRLRFKKQPKEYDDRTCVIVTDINGVSIGFIVDRVSDVMTFPESDLSDRPNVRFGDSQGLISKIAKVNEQVILLLDCNMLLNGDEYVELIHSI